MLVFSSLCTLKYRGVAVEPHFIDHIMIHCTYVLLSYLEQETHLLGVLKNCNTSETIVKRPLCHLEIHSLYPHIFWPGKFWWCNVQAPIAVVCDLWHLADSFYGSAICSTTSKRSSLWKSTWLYRFSFGLLDWVLVAILNDFTFLNSWKPANTSRPHSSSPFHTSWASSLTFLRLAAVTTSSPCNTVSQSQINW